MRSPQCPCTMGIGKDDTCKAELKAWFEDLSQQPCIFGNLKELVADKQWLEDLGFGKSTELTPTELFNKGLHTSDLKLHGLMCAVHSKQCRCSVRHADIHIAGTTCVDHSNYGSCTGDQGKNVKLFLIWVAMMRKLLNPIIMHENVAGFGTQALMEALGDLYVICKSVSCSSLIGWPIRRKRQMTILVLNNWIYPQLRSAGMSTSFNPHDVINLVNLQATLDSLSRRPCHLSWKDFCVASDADMHVETVEASRRPSVRRRWAGIDAGDTHGTDKNGKPCRLFPEDRGCRVLESLLPMERERIETVLWQSNPVVDVIDVSQNPGVRSRTIKQGDGTFMTVIAGSGYLVRLDQMRANHHSTTLITASDVLSMSGFAITDDQVARAGVASMFSRSRAASAPASRSPKSMKKQIGNAMHFSHVGLIYLCALLKFPALGTKTLPAPSSTKRSLPLDDAVDPPGSGSSGPRNGPASIDSESKLLRAVRARRASRAKP